MAKKKTTQNAAKERIERTEGYAEQVRREYAQAVNSILALKKSLPKLDTGVMYSFDNDSKKMQKQVENILRNLHSTTLATIKAGVKAEWEQANKEVDELITSALGKKALSNPQLAGWFDRNEKAMDTFIKRRDNGMNLSDRIWKNTGQLREEMEVAMTVAIGEGNSASNMSRKVRQYLNDPDLMFRRFRYKDEDGEWQLKWKKRIKTENGKYRFIDYDRDSYKVGAGNYKSSYKNAMRVTRTETNMAYRNADHERWQQLDFVFGQRIETSNAHPKDDICDELAGEYPKDFVFEGWHPQCFCICTAIMASEEEMKARMDAALKGESYTFKQKPVTTYPKGFKDWVKANEAKIIEAQERGTAPYFVTHNRDIIRDILDNKQPEENRLPKTLQHLEESISNYQYTDPELKARETEINAKMKDLFEQNDYGMNIHLSDLESIHDKGFLNTFQVGKSSAYNGSTKTNGVIEEYHARLVASHRMFSDANKNISSNANQDLIYTGQQYAREDYEKYGCLLDKDKTRSYNNRIQQYGDVQVRFKKEKVQCTWTFDDSLCASEKYAYYQPSLTTNPRIESFDENNIPYFYEYEGKSDKITNWLSSKDWNNLTQFMKRMGTDYIELQYHGNLTFDCVESITFGGNPETLLTKDFIDKMKNSGVELWYLDGKKVKKYKYQ